MSIPYYQSGGITIYNGDCRDIPVIPEDVFLMTDPPYGISERTNRKACQRTALAVCNDFPPIYGDDEPFDPAHLMRFNRSIIFGANHFAEKLPHSPSWIIWDKRAGMTSKRGDAFNDNGDAEMAWTNLGGPVRVISHLWMGMLKASEKTERRVHPTQKPVELFIRLITDHVREHEIIFDPYMGSGSVLVAAKQTGRRAIGIEISESYCTIAARRLEKTHYQPSLLEPVAAAPSPARQIEMEI